MTKIKTITFLSNGYGEDAVGVQLIRALQSQRPELRVKAFPTVDRGEAYEALKIPVLGPRKVMPSGGLLFHSLELFLTDLKAGFIPMTLRQLADLRQLETDVLVVIGDAFALLLSSLVKTRQRFYVQTLVSAHHSEASGSRKLNRYFMEHVSYPERALMRHLANWVYVRDEATAKLLHTKGLKRVGAFGNPMLDALAGKPMLEFSGQEVVALLPGTRQYKQQALELMLAALAQVSEVTGIIAWSGADLPLAPVGWKLEPAPGQQGLVAVFKQEQKTVHVYRNRFADVLHTAKFVLGTAGTANEQAAALGKPVISFPVLPLYSQTFLDNQKRLLAGALSVVEANPAAIAGAIMQLHSDLERYEVASRTGSQRMGKAGGSAAIIQDILTRL